MVSEMILRSQAQAVYSPANIGHFGLGLARYAHFTSPIRRYADLLVHRALIAGLRFGDGGLPPDAADEFPTLGEVISGTERRAATAERDALDRFTVSVPGRSGGRDLRGHDQRRCTLRPVCHPRRDRRRRIVAGFLLCRPISTLTTSSARA